MSRSYPIWCDTTNNSYTADKSYGAKTYTKTDVLIGSSSKNSHHFVSHETRVYNDDNGDKMFEFLIDTTVVKRAILKKGAKELLNMHYVN
tara:strand:- start:46 stop:315 length:270 start_codon:yes stop_codon:yes gene_type:complete